MPIEGLNPYLVCLGVHSLTESNWGMLVLVLMFTSILEKQLGHACVCAHDFVSASKSCWDMYVLDVCISDKKNSWGMLVLMLMFESKIAKVVGTFVCLVFSLVLKKVVGEMTLTWAYIGLNVSLEKF
jgi:hypothetical protein